MAITLGSEVALSLHMDTAPNYTDLEAAIEAAGFVNFTIMREVNQDGSGDAQLFLRGALDEIGAPATLNAADTLTAIATAIGSLDG